MPPKDWIIYIDPKGMTRAVIDTYQGNQRQQMVKEGNKIIGLVSSGREADAIAYAEQVLR